MFKRIKGQGGFTIIELACVLVVVAIIAAVAIPKFIAFTDEAKAGKSSELCGILNGQEQMFFAEATLDPSLLDTQSMNEYVWNEISTGVLARGDVSLTSATGASDTSHTIQYGETEVVLNRTNPINSRPGYWELP